MASRLNDKQKKKIIADYIETQNFSEVARMNNIDKSTVKRLIDKNYDEDMQQKATQKREENTQTTLEYMQSQHETKKRILDKLLKAIEEKSENVDMFTNIKDLATAYGIILDKELKFIEVRNNKQEKKETMEKLDELLKGIKDSATN